MARTSDIFSSSTTNIVLHSHPLKLWTVESLILPALAQKLYRQLLRIPSSTRSSDRPFRDLESRSNCSWVSVQLVVPCRHLVRTILSSSLMRSFRAHRIATSFG